MASEMPDALKSEIRRALVYGNPARREISAEWVNQADFLYDNGFGPQPSGLGCTHCLLLPEGFQDAHYILAMSEPGKKPYRGWFLKHIVDNMRRIYHGQQAAPQAQPYLDLCNAWEFREVGDIFGEDRSMMTLTLTVPEDLNYTSTRSYVYRLDPNTTMTVEGLPAILGVWAD